MSLSRFKFIINTSEYDIYGPDGADEWERKQMGLTIEEYEQYLKDGYVKNKK